MDEAIAQFERGVELSQGTPRHLSALGRAYALAGKMAEARDLLRRLEDVSQRRYVSPSYFASVHAAFNDEPRAFEYLERGFEERCGSLVYLHVDPQMTALRRNPRFDLLVERVRTLPTSRTRAPQP